MTAEEVVARADVMRSRLLLVAREHRRVRLVVAPAGCGKTTLLTHLVERAAVPGTRTSARDWDGNASPSDHRSFLAIDDVHELDTERTEALAELIEHGPPQLGLLLAGRAAPRARLSRLRAAGELEEIGPEDLRFRTWEIDELFRDVYGEPLTAGEVAALGRRTGGWAACLHLFHVATAGKAARTRREILASLPRGVRIIRDYLTQNVLEDLPERLRSFLVETSVLPTLTVPVCDRLLRRPGSRVPLEDLEDRRLLHRSATTDSWRCHVLLRDHLQALLLTEVTDALAIRRAAAEALEESGAVVEAFQVYVRAEEWGAAARLAAGHGEVLADCASASSDPLPPELACDPWIALASARRVRGEGRLVPAIAEYRRAEEAFGSAPGAEIARTERIALACWVEPRQQPRPDWAGALRAGLANASLEHPNGDSVYDDLVSGLLALVAGEVGRAIATLRRVAADERSSAATGAAAGVAIAAALALAGDAGAAEAAEAAAEEAEFAGLPGLVDVARVTRSPAGPAEPSGNPLTDAIAALFRGIDALRKGAPAVTAFDELIATAHSLELRPLEAWGRAGRALGLARAGDPAARSETPHSESIARVTGVRGAQAYALLACAEASDDAGLAVAAARLAAECGISLPPPLGASRVRIRCFGGLVVEADGRDVALDGLRPRSKQVLRLLLLHSPRPLHREVIADVLWPHLPPRRAASSLHVALSSLRHALGETVIRRDGDAYSVDTGVVDVDLAAFRAGTEREAGTAELQKALDLYRGEVFPEEGPAEWVVGERELLRERAVRAAQAVAERVCEDDPRAAAAACERGLALDRHSDGLWRLLVQAYERAGNPAAARRAAGRYDEILDELGVALGAR